jgi:hypothetical protein
MTSAITKSDASQSAAEMDIDLFDNWFDPIEIEASARPPGRAPLGSAL